MSASGGSQTSYPGSRVPDSLPAPIEARLRTVLQSAQSHLYPPDPANMPTQRRMLLYQLLASLIATGYALGNPPRCIEEHLRSLEVLDNLVLYYFVLGGYTSLVFSFFHWGTRSLVVPCVTGCFRVCLSAFNVTFIRVRLCLHLAHRVLLLTASTPTNSTSSTTTSTRTTTVVYVLRTVLGLAKG